MSQNCFWYAINQHIVYSIFYGLLYILYPQENIFITIARKRKTTNNKYKEYKNYLINKCEAENIFLQQGEIGT